MKKLFLLDAYALIYSAYYAFIKNPRINSKGLNTSAIYGFTNTLLNILEKEKPTHIAVVFDTHTPTKRHEIFPAYKANRQQQPEAITSAIPYIKEIVSAFNIPTLSLDGYEADDIIGTLAKKAEQQGFTVYMLTPDKDFSQLVTENIFLYRPARTKHEAEIWGIKEVCDFFEVDTPQKVVDVMGLWGDASDNIPGIMGIGEKTAKKLIATYGLLENVLENADKLPEKQKENIKKNADIARLSKQLATIFTDAPVELDEEKFTLKLPDAEQLKKLFTELEFKSLIQRVFEKPHATEKSDADLFTPTENQHPTSNIQHPTLITQHSVHSYHLIDTPEKRKELVAQLLSQKSFCFDTETTGLDVPTSELVGIAFAIKPHEAYFVPLPENFDDACKIINEFKPLFEVENIEKTGQNLKFDISVLKRYGIDVKGKMFDTMLAHYVLEPDLRHNINFIAESCLNYSTIPIEVLIGKKGKKQKSMREVPLAQLCEYACEDADITLQLKNILTEKLKENDSLQLFEEIEMPLIPVLISMEEEGVKIDVYALNVYSKELNKEIANIEKEIYVLAQKEFNISSPKQLGEVLFDELKIIPDAKRTTKSKQYSTGEEVLAKLKSRHPVIEKVLEYRQLKKLLNTYVEALPQLINPHTGRVHTSFNQAVAATGRLSSNNPNLQNIPIRTEKGKEVRKAFIPRNSDYILLSADYSQIELRLIAHFSQDKNLLSAFLQRQDIHTATAARIYNIPVEKVTPEMRRTAKTVNFGIIYGISAFGLSESMNISRQEAKKLIDQYFVQYPQVKDYIDKIIRFARENGYVQTIMGRRRYLRDINSSNATVRGYAERNAINTPIQGSAADIIKKAMIDIYHYLIENKKKTRILLQVHDELIFDVHKDELQEITDIIEDKMKNAVKISIPLEVDIRSGNNWLEAH